MKILNLMKMLIKKIYLIYCRKYTARILIIRGGTNNASSDQRTNNCAHCENERNTCGGSSMSSPSSNSNISEKSTNFISNSDKINTTIHDHNNGHDHNNVKNIFYELLKKKIIILKEFLLFCSKSIINFGYHIYKILKSKFISFFDYIKSWKICKYMISFFKPILLFIFKNIKKFYLEFFILVGITLISYNILYFCKFLPKQKIILEKFIHDYFSFNPFSIFVRASEDIYTVVKSIELDFSYNTENKENANPNKYALISSSDDLDFVDLDSDSSEKEIWVKRGKNVRIIRIGEYLIDQIEINLKRLDHLHVNLNSQNVATSEGYFRHKIMLELINKFIIDAITNMKKHLGIYFRIYKVVDKSSDTAAVIRALREGLIAVKGASLEDKIKYIARLITHGRIINIYAHKMAGLTDIMIDRITTFRKYKRMVSKINKNINVDSVFTLKLLISKIITSFNFLYFKFMEYKIEYLHSFKELDLFKKLIITKEDFYIRSGILKFLKKALASGESTTLDRFTEISAVEISTPKI